MRVEPDQVVSAVVGVSGVVANVSARGGDPSVNTCGCSGQTAVDLVTPWRGAERCPAGAGLTSVGPAMLVRLTTRLTDTPSACARQYW